MSARILRKIETEEPRLDYEAISVEPLTPIIGAEIRGIDLSKPLSAEQIADIRRAHAVHHVIYFRDQILSNEDHKRFARLFGTLHVHPYHAKNAAPDHAKTATADRAPFPESDPEILIVKADQKSKFVAGEGWHSDVTCDAEPPMGSMLYITQTPDIGGGDTMFASTIRAYDALSPMMKEILGRLTATHDGAKPYTGAYGTAPPPGGWPKTVHPVVITVPWNGKKSLYVNRGFTTRINELDRNESDAMLEMLWRHIETHVACQCRVKWTPNMLVFWDNWSVQHHAVWDYFPYSRYGQRVSIVNGRPAA